MRNLNIPNFIKRGFAQEKGKRASKAKKINTSLKTFNNAEAERIEATTYLHLLVTNQMLRVFPEPFMSKIV